MSLISDFEKKIKLATIANASIIQIISHDTLRVHAKTQNLAKEVDAVFMIWNQVQKLKIYTDDDFFRSFDIDFHDLIEWFSSTDDQNSDEQLPSLRDEQKYILLIEDAYPFLQENDHPNIARVKRYCFQKNSRLFTNRNLIFSQCMEHLPIELIKETQVFHLPYPDFDEITSIIENVKDEFNIPDARFNPNQLIHAARGLSSSELFLAFSKIAVSTKQLTYKEIPLMIEEKSQVIKKNGLLEYFQPSTRLEDIGGLDNLKIWLKQREIFFSEPKNAIRFGLEAPKGVLMLGLPGTGKSMTAKAVSQAWNLPLLRLDMGKIFGGILGQSEENMRHSLQLAETIAPCILWIDEIEKAMSGFQSSSQSDGGTTSRVLGSFLTWMQEKTSSVFVVATANKIEMLPPELLRKGRFDEIFFVDLPTFKDRIEIFKIHLKKRNHKDAKFTRENLETFSKLTQSFTGAEIEEVIKAALFEAFSNNSDLNQNHIENAIKKTTPLSITMSEMIEGSREWAKGRAVYANCEDPEDLRKSNSTIQLKQEGYNPFIKKNESNKK
jgi:ATP-dependent 26S proteasome regulatory subunit